LAADDDIMFARKVYLDLGPDFSSYVGISGTLTGDGVGFPNTYAISCFRETKAFFISSIEQIGRNQVGRLQDPYSYPIVKWNADEIVAAEEPAFPKCNKVTI